MMTLRSRAWCFTINNDTFDDLEKMLDMTFQYLVFGFETGGKKKVCIYKVMYTLIMLCHNPQ